MPGSLIAQIHWGYQGYKTTAHQITGWSRAAFFLRVDTPLIKAPQAGAERRGEERGEEREECCS
eukprot:1711034-Rhodomonas_salina.1